MTLKEFIDFGWQDSHVGYEVEVTPRMMQFFPIDRIGVDKDRNLLLCAGNTRLVHAHTILAFIKAHYTQKGIREKKIKVRIKDTIYDTYEVLVNGMDEKVAFTLMEEDQFDSKDQFLYEQSIEKAFNPTELNICDMRDATPEEQKGVTDYIMSIAEPTGITFDDIR